MCPTRNSPSARRRTRCARRSSAARTTRRSRRLTEQLRAALDKFLQALAEEIRKHPELARRADPNGRYLRSQDLKNMIDRLEQMARSGAKDAARQLLDQLQQMLENLQMARPGQGMDGDMDDDMMSMLDDLGKMLRDQQQLRDRTFKQGQDQRRQQRGQRGQQGQQGRSGSAGTTRWASCVRTNRRCVSR